MLRNFADNPLLLLVLILIIILVFGAKRLPDAARSLGRSMRIFKSEVKEMREDDDDDTRRRAPLEGRVVDDPARRSTVDPTGERTGSVHRPGAGPDEPHRG
ncbi:Sec-independent protein translocase subunit TatA [Kineosporiaceae bacterium SCSIO 59966]|nr:Sec-independent protein translocase subunit TatA [Kineosporiaceae bacterium SCSIO 59966]